MKHLLIRFCNTGGSSAGTRDYLERFLVPFATANPQIQISVERVWGRHPIARATYLQDGEKTLSLRGLSAEMVVKQIKYLRDCRPIRLRKFDKPFRTSPSIQGEWEQGQSLARPHRTILCE